jgi:hypothetical protein
MVIKTIATSGLAKTFAVALALMFGVGVTPNSYALKLSVPTQASATSTKIHDIFMRRPPE